MVVHKFLIDNLTTLSNFSHKCDLEALGYFLGKRNKIHMCGLDIVILSQLVHVD
jgi:hypothetical protein